MDDPLRLPPAVLTAHQPPALLVAAVTACDNAGNGAARLLPGPWDALQLAEGCAQTVACLMGVRARRQASGDGSPASGMLVGLRDVVCRRGAESGEAATVAATLVQELGPFAVYDATVTGADGHIILSGSWKTMSTPGAP
jgi:hypothetical protein